MSKWLIKERKQLSRGLDSLPLQVLKKYELWKMIVESHGPAKLREFPGFHDEKLQGERFGQRSSRLSLKYRVIYVVARAEVTVYVIDLNAHEY